MVLGIKSKSRKNVSIPVDYVINVQDIKPCPSLSQSQKSALSSVFLQWECLGQPPGSFTSEVKDGTIDFSDTFRLSTNLIREASKKSKARESYRKNLLEFFLYEPRKDKPTEGHLLGSTLINLAQYGVIRDTISVSAPLSCKKLAKNSDQPILYLSIQAIGNEGIDSVSEATGEEEEAELASFTDDDIDDDNSSRSSRTTTSSKGHSATIEPEISRGETSSKGSSPLPKTSSSPRLSPMGYSFNPRIGTNDSYIPSDKSVAILKKSVTQGVRNSSSAFGYQDNQQKPVIKIPSEPTARVSTVSNVASSSKYSHERARESHDGSRVTREDDGKVSRTSRNAQEETKLVEPRRSTSRENGQRESLAKKEYSFDVDECRLSPNTGMDDETSTYSGGDMINRLKHVKSAQLTSDASKKDELLDITEFYPKRIELSRETRSGSGGLLKTTSIGRGDLNENETKNELQLEIERLKDELTEAAAVEVGLYSIVAEHGSSANKMHAPARRISRFYSHACKSGSKTKKANAARTAISGFILVSKACGNDVPRLTFWLSNSIVLRAIISQTIRKPQVYGWQGVSNKIIGKFYGLDEPQNFMGALEKFESWVFSRIVESVWWQTITPHMQPAAAKASTSKKVAGKKNGFGDNEQGNLSIELWKKAFKDSCQRLCPSRAVGHECGCLPVLSRLVMEQLVNRLDVAMFNAILRENGEEMPTDPVSDPISDSKVLPIPAGRSSFGAGVQLKNAIGSWSRFLADIFDIDDGPDEKGETNVEEKPESQAQPFKAFRLLNALSDLMMIPFEMLLDESIRKEVCPSLNATLIRMVLCNFVPDEFNPAPIPDEVFEALDSQADGESATHFPFPASPTVYTLPSATSLTSILGDFGAQSLQKNKSHVLRKSYTSDDELDELDSPVALIIKENFLEKRKSERKVVRYQLLREAWKGHE